jgi:hypothetical protein
MSLFRPTHTDKATGARKESATWWFEFTHAGKRIRKSAKTSRRTVAAEAEKKRWLDLEWTGAGMPSKGRGRHPIRCRCHQAVPSRPRNLTTAAGSNSFCFRRDGSRT